MGSSFDRLVWELRLFFGPAGLAIAPTVNNGDGVIAMIKRRIAVVGAALLCTAAMLIVRLAQIQLFDTESFSNEKINLIDKSIEQRTTAFIVDDGRGVIADRNGEILNVKEKNALILFPFLKNASWPADTVAAILNVPRSSLLSAVKNADKPFAFKRDELTISAAQKAAINRLNIPGVQVLTIRYRPAQSASFVVGAVGENPEIVRAKYPDLLRNGGLDPTAKVGIIGLEKAFDPFLLSTRESKLLYHTAAGGAPLFGGGVKISGESESDVYPLKVVTTLDRNIQEMAEREMAAAGITKGGVVILDANTSDLLAMASRPEMDPKHPFKQENLMLAPAFPGSVFKIVTAAAAIEKNIVSPTEHFNCDQNPYGTGRGDRTLGTLNFEESFYQSCNYTFATLSARMMETDPKVLDRYAAKLGLTEPVGWTGDVYRLKSFKHFPDEGKNTIWLNESERQDPKAIAQTAIGQRNVKLTPLSVANLMATIARGGEKWQVRAATAVDYHKMPGVSVAAFPHQKMTGETIEPYTAMRLQALLRGVVKDSKGTGHRLADAKYPIAGKSGTAETGSTRTNQWFAGYFPADRPKYAMIVVDLQGDGQSAKIYEAYERLVNDLYQYDHGGR